MENKESDTMMSIIFVAVFLCVVLLAVVVIIGALNSGNVTAGHTLSGSGSETLYNVVNSPQTLYAGGVANPACSVTSVSVKGITIPASNYTVSGCQVTYFS